MEITIKGESNEIAALVVSVQERRLKYADFLSVIFAVTHGCLKSAEAKYDTW